MPFKHGAVPLRVLVIGAGPAAAMLHLPALARLRDNGGIILQLVCDLQPERTAAAARKFGFLERGGDAAAALKRSDIDAVYVFGSAQMHFEYGLEALRNGKHLFVEKPIAPSSAQARELALAASAQGLVAAGGHNRRFYKSFAVLRARAGKAGWRFAEATSHKPQLGKPPPFGASSWLGANGIHALDALVFMMGGLPEHVSAFSSSPDAFCAVMRWPGGAQGVFLSNNQAGARREEYAFHAAGETCRVTDQELAIEAGGTISKAPFAAMMDGFAAEHDAFLDAIRSGVEPPHGIAALAPSLFLAELIESGFTGRVRLPGLPGKPVPRPQVDGTGILVVEPARLMPALAGLFQHHRLVSVDDVRRSPNARPDITAALLGRNAAPLPPDILEKLPGLAVVGVMGLSLARIAPDALLARGVTLVNASAAYAETVAEFALGLAILGRRRAFISDGIMHAGGWGTQPSLPGWRGVARRAARVVRPGLRALGLEPHILPAWRKAKPFVEAPGTGNVAGDLRGATVGLIGWGHIAAAFTARLIHAGARVLAYSEHAAQTDIRQSGAEPAALGEILGADIVSLHRGLSPATRHFLGAAELARLRPGALLINVGRGALIEPGALLARLRQGDIFACLDTFEEEPLPVSNPLRLLPNVLLTSHIAGGTPEMHAAAADEVVRKVAAYLNGEAVSPISAGAFTP